MYGIDQSLKGSVECAFVCDWNSLIDTLMWLRIETCVPLIQKIDALCDTLHCMSFCLVLSDLLVILSFFLKPFLSVQRFYVLLG